MKITHHLVTPLNSGAVRITLSVTEIASFRELIAAGKESVRTLESSFNITDKKELREIDRTLQLADKILERV